MIEPSETFDFKSGSGPLLVSIPHAGELVPDDVRVRMSTAGQALPDTDWYVDRLYDFLNQRNDISVIKADYSRYMVDLNRPADGSTLYPDSDETGLCPRTTFAHEPIYLSGREADEAEVGQRIVSYWQPYHQAIEQYLQTLRERHGMALLWDAHSIASRVPRFFEQRIPDYSFGTASDQACPAAITQQVLATAIELGLEAVANQRFKGGYITRHYGRPHRQIYALQLELSQRCYMDEAATGYDSDRAKFTASRLVSLIDTFVTSATASLA